MNAGLSHSSTTILHHIPIIPGGGNAAETSEISMKAYPNPFMTSTEVEFKLGWDGHAKVEVYNMIGVKVSTLFNGNVNANDVNRIKYSVPDEMGQGVLFLKITTERGTVVDKIIINR